MVTIIVAISKCSVKFNGRSVNQRECHQLLISLYIINIEKLVIAGSIHPGYKIAIGHTFCSFIMI